MTTIVRKKNYRSHLVAAGRMTHQRQLSLSDRNHLIGSLFDQYVERQKIMLSALRRAKRSRNLSNVRMILATALAEVE